MQNEAAEPPHLRSPYTRVILNGFMGAGKSTVGKQLAPLLGWRFVDVDAILVERTDMAISDLFTWHGEQHFREMEAALIEELLTEEEIVIALGGGAIEDAGTRTHLAESPACLIIYLEASLQVSLARCALDSGMEVCSDSGMKSNAAERPVLQDTALLERRFQLRLPFYQSAHLTIGTAGLAPLEIAHQIVNFVRL